MFIDPRALSQDLPRLEEIEKASLRLVTQALCDFQKSMLEIFSKEKDLAADIGEDITREALDRMGVSKIDQRLYGKIDYKRARYVFHPEYAIKQALFVDSKAEKKGGQANARIQTSQLSMKICQIRAGKEVCVPGELSPVLEIGGEAYLTTTVFVKYSYEATSQGNHLRSVIIAALPSGFLQEKYNPDSRDSIWLAGPNAPTLGEKFRVRLSFQRLQAKARWRVQRIPLPPQIFQWQE